MKNRTTPDLITSLQPGQIFVFGSNEGGKHGKFAAKTAMKWGAKWGQAEGLQGKTYGIPTKDKTIKRILDIEEIKPYVDRFLEYARTAGFVFLVTQVGCGAAGYKPKDIAPLFAEARDIGNIHLPESFWEILQNG